MHEHFVVLSLGNLRRPHTDQQLYRLFLDQAVLSLPEPMFRALLERCWRLDELESLMPVLEVAVP
jgi:hypothetical protein